jgi:hypothetical protein
MTAVLGLLLAGAWAVAQEEASLDDVADESPAYDLWFPIGEELIYDIHWGVINAGRSRVTSSWVEHEGRQVIAIRYVTKSNRVVDKIYPVDDFIESLIDPETFLPIRHIKRLSEGRYRADEVTTFDFEKLEATWESKNRPRRKVFPIEKDTRDVVTFMYYLRQKPFSQGDIIQQRIMADEKLYDLSIRVRGTDTMKFPRYGRVRSIRLDPEAAFQGIFVRKGKLTLWVSDDDRRVCTRMMATIPVANIRITLAEVRGPGDDRWVRGQQADEGVDDDDDEEPFALGRITP